MKTFILMFLLANIIAVMCSNAYNENHKSPKGQSWSYGTKINHPVRQKGYSGHGNNGHAYVQSYDSGSGGHKQDRHYTRDPHYKTDNHRESYSPRDSSYHSQDIEDLLRVLQDDQSYDKYNRNSGKNYDSGTSDINIDGILDSLKTSYDDHNNY